MKYAKCKNIGVRQSTVNQPGLCWSSCSGLGKVRRGARYSSKHGVEAHHLVLDDEWRYADTENHWIPIEGA